MMTGHKPNLKNMHIFGTVRHAYIQNKKLEARCERGIFLGYDMESPAYLIYFPGKDDIKQVRCVKFSKNFECLNDDIIDVPEEYSYSRPDEDEQPQIEKSKDDADKRKDEESIYPQRNLNKPKNLDDYAMDDEVSNAARCSIDYC